MRLNFDWKDGWLVSLGFAAAVGISTLLRARDIELSRGLFQALVVGCIFAAPAARRALFGAPRLGPRRDGLLWSLGSMFGLGAMFFGLGALLVTSLRISSAQEVPPDFLAEELAYLDAPSPLDDILPNLAMAEESEATRNKQRAKERKEAEAQARMRAQERKAQWEKDSVAEDQKTWTLSAAAAALLAFGSLLMSIRYAKVS